MHSLDIQSFLQGGNLAKSRGGYSLKGGHSFDGGGHSFEVKHSFTGLQYVETSKKYIH